MPVRLLFPLTPWLGTGALYATPRQDEGTSTMIYESCVYNLLMTISTIEFSSTMLRIRMNWDFATAPQACSGERSFHAQCCSG